MRVAQERGQHLRLAEKQRERRDLAQEAWAVVAGRPRRYITRPAIAELRLLLASNGNVVPDRCPVVLKTPYDDGPTGTSSPRLY